MRPLARAVRGPSTSRSRAAGAAGRDAEEEDSEVLGPNQQQLVHVPPDDFLEYVTRGGALQQGQGLARHALARHACGRGIVVLAHAAAAAVGAAAIAAEEQFVLMPLQKIRGEGGIA